MKKWFKKKVGGYYIVSLMAGVMLGLLILIGENFAGLYKEQVLWQQYEAGTITFDTYATYDWVAPLYHEFNLLLNCHLTIIIGILCIFTVILYSVMIVKMKQWRTKFLQSIGWALFLWFASETLLVAENLYDMTMSFGLKVLLPVVLLIISVLILIKTREPGSDMHGNKSREPFISRLMNWMAYWVCTKIPGANKRDRFAEVDYRMNGKSLTKEGLQEMQKGLEEALEAKKTEATDTY